MTYRVVWHQQSIQGKCNNHTSPESRVNIKPPWLPCTYNFTNHEFSHQETVRHDLGRDYPGLAANIRGEESSSFTNTLGETLRIRVCEDVQKTAKLLEQVRKRPHPRFEPLELQEMKIKKKYRKHLYPST